MANNRINITISAKDDASRVVDAVAGSAVKANKAVGDSAKAAAARSRISAAELSSSFGSVADSLGGLLSKGTAVAAAGSFGIGAMAKAALDQVSAVEQATVALKAYEPNAAKVTNTLADLVKYAQSPMGVLFQRQDLFAAAQGLKIMGDNTDNLVDHVKIMSRSVGLGLSTFEGLGNVIQRVGSTGKLYADDLQFLQNAGFRLDSTLGGTTQTFESLFALLDKGIPANAMAGQADTLKGKLVTLQSGFRGLGNQFLDVDAKTSKFAKDGLGAALMTGLDSLVAFLKTPEMKDGFAKMGSGAADFTKAALPMVQDVLSWFVNNSDTVAAGIAGLATAFLAAKGAAVVFAIATSPLTAIAAAAAILAGGIAFLQLKFDIFGKSMEAVKKTGEFLYNDFLVPVGNFFRDTFTSAVDAGKDSVKWLNDRVDDASKAFETFKGWLEENDTAIKIVSTTLGVVFGPALIGIGALAVATGVKVAASGIASGAGWVKGAAIASASWVVHKAKMTALSIAIRTMLIKDAIVSGAAWVKNAAIASGSWALHMAKTSLSMTKTAIVASLKAADAAWAWTFNAMRVSIVWATHMTKVAVSMAGTAIKAGVQSAIASAVWVKNAAVASAAWVVKELPKIVAAFVVTAASATTQAAVASAAWASNAARSAAIWVVTELPKIVAAFVVTSGSAVAQAAVSSAAWVGSASKSAVAWVVTSLPKIIAAFVATSGAAIANAAIATAAWVASAATSSSAVVALGALVATPIVMPAIAVAAALGAIASVWNAYNNMKTAVEGAKQARQDLLREEEKILKKAYTVINDGISSPATKARWQKVVDQVMSNASGTNASPGGRTLVGEHGPEIVDMPRGATVTPAYRTRSESGGGQSSGHTIHIENMNINNGGDRHRLLSDIGFALETAS
ncbi:hypothetical protein KRR55_06050 [Paeniglutamicibacter sp. ABSL32-1]|uniref:hypothetical protein n=1 Tax=Paeniglutamicibacter quisquiliarum TaxID=2849498 RepID=UPI001C2CF5E7|nr:hypothetical protein [Paeniglutamicibacter quisquiliarum]MBV1778674.1 hypothetical protein [Paeniglutamicibacter quisquiliarum]